MLALVWGLVLSRFGLWSFDLAVNQLLQESVDAGSLGAVSGVQGSLQSFFQARLGSGWRLGGCRAALAELLACRKLCTCSSCRQLSSTPLRPEPPPTHLQMLAYAVSVAVPATDAFVWLMACSCGTVLLAAACYTAFALRAGCGHGLDPGVQLAPAP